jgi:SOS response regulatory protein OraA/RecX
MQIIAVKPTLRPNRINLLFDNQKYLPFFVDDFVALGLKKNEPLAPEIITEICRQSVYFLAKDYCLRQISISPKVEKTLTPKLKNFLQKVIKKYDYPVAVDLSKIIESCLLYLNSQKLLDETKFVNYYLKRYPRKSQNELLFRLRQLGVSVSVVSDQSEPNSDREKIIKILQKKKITSEIMRNYQEKNRLYSSLYRKGFSLSQVKSVIDEYLLSG